MPIARLRFAALLPLLLAGTAFAADIPGGTSTRATLPVQVRFADGAWETGKDSDWYRIELERGEAYAIHLLEVGDAFGFTAALRDHSGRLLKEDDGNQYIGARLEFVAPSSGVFYVEAKLQRLDGGTDGAYAIVLGPDCVRGLKTTCRLRPGKPQQRQLFFGADVDWYEVTLQAGGRYSFEVENPEESGGGNYPSYPYNLLALELVDAAGRVLATGVNVDSNHRRIDGFRARNSGTYYLRTYSEDGEGYFGGYRIRADRE